MSVQSGDRRRSRREGGLIESCAGLDVIGKRRGRIEAEGRRGIRCVCFALHLVSDSTLTPVLNSSPHLIPRPLDIALNLETRFYFAFSFLWRLSRSTQSYLEQILNK